MIRNIVFVIVACAVLVYMIGRALDVEAAGDDQRIEQFKRSN